MNAKLSAISRVKSNGNLIDRLVMYDKVIAELLPFMYSLLLLLYLKLRGAKSQRQNQNEKLHL